MSAIFRHSIAIIRAATSTDVYGDDVESWDDAPETPSGGWSVSVGDTRTIGGDAGTAGREGAVIAFTLRHKGLTVDVRGTDRVRYAGEVYRIDGEVMRQPGPTWRTDHTIIALSRVTG